jgi:hypothetical protein
MGGLAPLIVSLAKIISCVNTIVVRAQLRRRDGWPVTDRTELRTALPGAGHLLHEPFIVGIDVTIVKVALPQIQRSLHAPVNGLQWTVDAYTLVIACLLMLSGSLADPTTTVIPEGVKRRSLPGLKAGVRTPRSR